VLCVAVVCVPSIASGDWKQFLPRPFENGIFLETFTSYERDELRSGNRSTRWYDIFLREKMTLFSNGYSYHPRFLQYQFSLAGALKQEDYESAAHSGWRDSSGIEYDAKIFLLPEHRYNLRAYAARYEPLFKEQAATEHDSVLTTRGVSARYRDKPYFLSLSYAENLLDSTNVSSDVRRAGADGEYFKRYESGNEVSFHGAFNPTWFDNSAGLDGTSYDSLLGNFVNLKWARLTSNVSRTTLDQDDRVGSGFESEQLSWHELFTAYLPWSFRTDLAYRHRDNEATIDDPRFTGDRTLSDRGRDLQFNLIHRLYESVDTTYSFLRDWRTSFGGETDTLTHSLGINYTKKIPRGRILLGTNATRSDTDSEGDADVVNEPHAAIAVPGSFALAQQNVEPGSIVVFFRSPIPPFELVPLVENVHYVIVPVGNATQIDVLTVPPEFVVPGTFDLFVSYSLAAGDFELRTDSYGGNASVELFDNLLTPYFSYLTVEADVLSGTFPGSSLDSESWTTGVSTQRGPFRARGEYQRLEWEVSPYRAWRAQLQYVGHLDRATSVYTTLSYVNKHYPRGTSPSFRVSFTEETESASGSVQRRLIERMYLSIGGTYTRLDGIFESDAYSVHGSWNWSIGRSELSLGTTAYASNVKGRAAFSTEREHQLVYFKFRRDIF